MLATNTWPSTGFGTTLLPASALAAGHPGLLAIPADDPRLAWRLSAAISARRPPAAATSALLAALTESAADLSPPVTATSAW